jgi:hypothetical protein
MDGLAGYRDDETDWETNLQAARASQISQWRKFPQSDMTGAKTDNDYFFTIVREHFAGSVAGNIWESVSKKANALLETHWSAVVEISEKLIAAERISVDENEHSLAKRKKQLGGEELVAILSSHGISARVRPVSL